MTRDSAKHGNRLLTRKPENREFITEKTINRLVTAARNGDAVDRIIWDEGYSSVSGKRVYAEPGLGVRTTVSGQVAFIFNYHFDKKEHRIKIHDHQACSVSEAREQAHVWRQELKDGHDPLEERQVSKEEPTFAELAADWLVHAKNVKHKRESSLYDDRRMLGLNEDGTPIVDEDPTMRKRRILSVFGERRLSRITQREIAVFHTTLKETPYRANRSLVLMKTIFNFALRDARHKGWIEENPCMEITPFPEEVHENCLDKEQIDKFIAALNRYPDQNAANCLRLMLLTGCRVSEALTAEWKNFDLSRGEWIKLSHNTKQKKTEHLQLGDKAVDLLRSMKPKNATGPLFPGAKRKGKGGKLTGGEMRESLKRPWLQICKAVGLVKVDQVEGRRKNKDGSPKMLKRYKPTVRLHDLRHTYASVLVSNGESLYAVGKQLGHVQPTTTNRYTHFAPEAGKATANKFAQVIEFKKRA